MSDPKQCNDRENNAIGETPQPMAVPMNAPEPRQGPLAMNRQKSTENDAG